MKRILAFLLAVTFVFCSCCVAVSADEVLAASADATPFRVNVSRIDLGTDPNMGTYFLFDGQESALNSCLYSRGILAEWDDALGAYKCTGSLGYNGDKTGWDIPATGFALMISAFADGNAFDQANFGAATYFSYNDTSKDNALVGSPVYLYNIDLKEGTVKTAGTEGAEDFTSESYVMVGSADSTATVEAYNGAGVSITKAPLPNGSNSLLLSHYHATPGLYRDAWGTADTDDIYDQAFIIDPTEYETQEDLEEALDVIAWCFVSVLEAVDLEHRVYKVIHTEGWTDKCDWAYCDPGLEDCWLWKEDGTPNENRLLAVAMIMNQSEEGKYGCLTYDFGVQNSTAGYSGMSNGYGECEPNTGSFLGKYATFYNVDFEHKLVLTSGDWGTPEFASQSYILFTDNMPTEYPEPVDLTTTTAPEATTTAATAAPTAATSSNATSSTAATAATEPAEEDSEGGFNILLVIIPAAVIIIAAIIIIIAASSKKKKAAPAGDAPAADASAAEEAKAEEAAEEKKEENTEEK